MIQNSVYYIKEIPASEASIIVKQFHYSKKVVSNSKLHLGVFLVETGKLVGCLQYGPPMNGKRTASKISDSESMMELNRMVLDDDQPRNSESMAIALCNKYLKKYTNIDYILSFSDGKQGNVGCIYQSSNWVYLGYTVSKSFYDLDGEIKHSVTVWHQYKEKHPDRDIKTTHEILCDNFDNISIIYSKQHIYVFPLRKYVKFKFLPQSYPKKDLEVEILSRKWIKRCGSNCSDVELNTQEVLTPIF